MRLENGFSASSKYARPENDMSAPILPSEWYGKDAIPQGGETMTPNVTPESSLYDNSRNSKINRN